MSTNVSVTTFIGIKKLRGGLPNKGRYGCAASAKPRPGKILLKKPNAKRPKT